MEISKSKFGIDEMNTVDGFNQVLLCLVFMAAPDAGNLNQSSNSVLPTAFVERVT